MSFYLFRRYFFSSRSGSLIRLVSWVCLLGMAVSISALILIVSIMGGFGEAIKSRLLDKEPHLVIYFDENPFLKTIPTPANETKSLFLDKEQSPFILSSLTEEQKKDIRSNVIFETQDLILKSPEGFKGVMATGYPEKSWDKKISESSMDIPLPEDENSLNPHPIQKPLPLKPNPLKEVLLSYELSLQMGLSPGDSITLIPITGLLLPSHLPPPVKQFQVKGILPPAQSGKEAFSIYYKQGGMDFGNFSKINYKAEIQFHDPEKVHFYQKLFSKYKTQNWIERNSTLFFALKLEKFVMTLFFILALLISCLGISSTLFLLMTQKGEDLAILHAMGLSQKEIVKTFTQLGFFLALMGLLIGAGLGLSGTLFLKYNESISFLPEIYEDRTIPAIFMPFNYLMILLGALILSWISCYLPTKYLSRIKPAELLKISGF